MPARSTNARIPPGDSAVTIFTANEQINQILIQNLDPMVWTATPPGNVRTIAAIFTHMHNIRAKWIRLTAPHLGVPAPLKRAYCTPREASKAFADSAARCERMLAEAEAGRIHHFLRDSWAKPWPVGPGNVTAMLSYMLTHEAHHRGQVTMLAHQLRSPLPRRITARMWNWESLRK